MSRLLFIVNPKSGIRKKIDIPVRIKAIISSSHSFEIAITEHKAHATELATRAVADKFDAVIGIGGDGTINECALALLHSQIPLGIIPMGSGNGLARHLKLPMNIDDGLRAITKLKHRDIDTGKFNGHLFLSNAGLGFVAAVAADFDKSNVRRGFTGYSLHTLKTYFSYKSIKYKIVADGKEINDDCFMVNICNSNQFGYNAKICPVADIDDGYLDVVLVHKAGIFNTTKVIYQLFMGNVLKNRFVTHLKAKNIEIQSTIYSHSQVDGEPLALTNSATAAVEPLSLKVIIP
jgi:diacylglycerol kinase (ATP)